MNHSVPLDQVSCSPALVALLVKKSVNIQVTASYLTQK